jgi:hypothetical protein
MSEGIILPPVEKGLRMIFDPSKKIWNDKDKVFVIIWVGILIIATCLITFADKNAYSNPVMAKIIEFIVTLSANVFLLFNLVKLMAGDAVEGNVGIPVLISVLAFAVVVIGTRIVFLGFNTMYLVGPDFTVYSGFWPENLRFVPWISATLAYVVQFTVLRMTSKISWDYLWMPVFFNMIAGNIFLMMVNFWVYFAFYFTGTHL